ncbi:MAG TPA: response regulator transcription factor [Cyclobacteriaceae bacterium]|nr:response regulator transcription factor [Cyclobacteriaceae bacterium]
MLKVILYEDNESLRESIATMFSLDNRFQLAGSFGDVMNVDEQVAAITPDCILMDIDMPGVTGIEAVRRLRQNQCLIPIIMLTVFDDNVHVLDAIQSGASGYILKKHISTRLFASLDEVMEGGAPMSPAIARMVIASMQKKNSNAYGLTPRENEILKSLSTGNSYKMIASAFQISIDTVRAHIKKIYEKLQVHSQTEAVSKAINERLV